MQYMSTSCVGPEVVKSEGQESQAGKKTSFKRLGKARIRNKHRSHLEESKRSHQPNHQRRAARGQLLGPRLSRRRRGTGRSRRAERRRGHRRQVAGHGGHHRLRRHFDLPVRELRHGREWGCGRGDGRGARW